MNTKPNDRFKMVVATHLILIKNSKVLLGKRQNTGWNDGKYHLCGGHIESGETAFNATIREGAEELGVIVEAGDLKLVHLRNSIRSDHSRMELFFMAEHWTGEAVNKEPELCSDINWFDISNLPADITFESREVLKMITEKINYSEIYSNE